MLINTEATANLAQQFCVCVSVCVLVCVWALLCALVSVSCTVCVVYSQSALPDGTHYLLDWPRFIFFFTVPTSHPWTHTHTQGHTHRLTAQGCAAPRVMADWFFPPHFALKKTFTSYTHRQTHMPVFHLVPSASVSLNWKGTSRVQKCSEG